MGERKVEKRRIWNGNDQMIFKSQPKTVYIFYRCREK